MDPARRHAKKHVFRPPGGRRDHRPGARGAGWNRAPVRGDALRQSFGRRGAAAPNLRRIRDAPAVYCPNGRSGIGAADRLCQRRELVAGSRRGAGTRNLDRMAIGAGRVRVIRQLLIESVVLSVAGGFFGFLTALTGIRWMDRFTLAQGRPPWVNLEMNARIFIFLAAISIGTGILFGLAPALRLAKIDVNSAVKDGAGATGGPRGRRVSNLLVILEMALCVVLLAGAGLLIRSSLNVYNAPTGVNSSNVLTAHVNLPKAKYRRAEDEIEFHRELKARLESLPGVESASIASALPTWGYGLSTIDCEIEGEYIQNPIVQAVTVMQVARCTSHVAMASPDRIARRRRRGNSKSDGPRISHHSNSNHTKARSDQYGQHQCKRTHRWDWNEFRKATSPESVRPIR